MKVEALIYLKLYYILMGNGKPEKKKMSRYKQNKCKCSGRLKQGTRLINDELFLDYCIYVSQPRIQNSTEHNLSLMTILTDIVFDTISLNSY